MKLSNHIKNVEKDLINVIIVTYNPNIDDLFKNIYKFMDGVDSIILVDNASNEEIQKKLVDFCSQNKKVKFVPMEINNGIGSAQNEAVRLLFDQQNDDQQFVLFFDQDSYLTSSQVHDLVQHFKEEHYQNSNLAALGAQTNENIQSDGRYIVKHIISSGSLTTLNTFKQIGYFDEELFIDFIDFAWCWKAEKLGYYVMVDNSVLLHHQTSGHLPTIFGKGIDNPNRLYYVYRNLIISLNRYNTSFSFSWNWYKHLFMKAIFQLIFASNRIYRLKMILSGVFDGLKGKAGK